MFLTEAISIPSFFFLSEISTDQSCASAVNLVRLSSITGGYF